MWVRKHTSGDAADSYAETVRSWLAGYQAARQDAYNTMRRRAGLSAAPFVEFAEAAEPGPPKVARCPHGHWFTELADLAHPSQCTKRCHVRAAEFVAKYGA